MACRSLSKNDRDAIAAISANVAGNFHLLDSTLLTSGSSRAIEARSIQIGKTLRASNTSITGLTFLANAAIRGSLLLEEKSSLSVHQGIAVFGENLSVAEDLQFFDLDIQGMLAFRSRQCRQGNQVEATSADKRANRRKYTPSVLAKIFQREFGLGVEYD